MVPLDDTAVVVVAVVVTTARHRPTLRDLAAVVVVAGEGRLPMPRVATLNILLRGGFALEMLTEARWSQYFALKRGWLAVGPVAQGY